MPKPLNKKEPRKAIVFSLMWAEPGRRLWTYHNEEKIYFRKCEDARQWATKHGFDGVKFDTVETYPDPPIGGVE